MKFPTASNNCLKIKSNSTDAVIPKAETSLAMTSQELQKCYFSVTGLEKDPFSRHFIYITSQSTSIKQGMKEGRGGSRFAV